jgi:hypothetical protein
LLPPQSLPSRRTEIATHPIAAATVTRQSRRRPSWPPRLDPAQRIDQSARDATPMAAHVACATSRPVGACRQGGPLSQWPVIAPMFNATITYSTTAQIVAPAKPATPMRAKRMRRSRDGSERTPHSPQRARRARPSCGLTAPSVHRGCHCSPRPHCRGGNRLLRSACPVSSAASAAP